MSIKTYTKLIIWTTHQIYIGPKLIVWHICKVWPNMHFVIFKTLSILYSCCEKSWILNNDLKMRELSRKKWEYYDWQMIQLLNTYLHDENQFSPFSDISVGKSMYLKTPLERSDLNWLPTKFSKNHEKICFFPYSNLNRCQSKMKGVFVTFFTVSTC